MKIRTTGGASGEGKLEFDPAIEGEEQEEETEIGEGGFTIVVTNFCSAATEGEASEDAEQEDMEVGVDFTEKGNDNSAI